MKNKKFLSLIALLSCLGFSPTSNASEKKSKGFGAGSLVISALGGATVGGLATGFTVHGLNQVDTERYKNDYNSECQRSADLRKQCNSLEERIKKLTEENEKLKKGNPQQPGDFSEAEKQKMQNRIDQLEEDLKQKLEAYEMLLNTGDNKDELVTQLKEQIRSQNVKILEMKKEMQGMDKDIYEKGSQIRQYEQAVGRLDTHVKNCPDLRNKLDYLCKYFKPFYQHEEYKTPDVSYSLQDSPFYRFDDDDFECLKNNKGGLYSMRNLQDAIEAYEQHKENNDINNLKSNDYQNFLMKGFKQKDTGLNYKKIFLNLILLYNILCNTSNLTN